MKKLIIFIALALNIFLLAGSTSASSGHIDSPWPIFHGNSKLTGQSPYDTSKVNGTVKWRFDAAAGIENSPVIAHDGTIYIADHTCNLYAIDPASGKEKWHFDAGEPVTSKEWGGSSCFQASPSVAADGTIYIAPMTGYLFAIDSTGKEKWRYPVFNFKNNWSSPSLGPDGTIYVGSESYPPPETGKPEEKHGIIYALNPDGTLKWQYDTGGNWSTSTASITDDGTVYMSGNDSRDNNKNKLFAFNGQTGEIKWKFDHGGVLESSASIGSDGTIYFGVKGRINPREGAKFFAVTPEGRQKWSLDMPCGNSITPGIATDGTIYFGDWDGAFYAISPEGKIIWKVDTPKSFESLSSSPAIGSDGTVYFGSLANYFYAYTPEGKEKWKFRVNNGINSSPAIGSDGTVYVGQTGGELLAFGTSEQSSSANAKSSKTSDTKNSSNNKLLNKILIGLIILLLLITLGLIFYFKKHGVFKRIWLILFVLILAVVYLLLVIVFPKKEVITTPKKVEPQVDNTLEEMFKYGEEFEKICPDKIIFDKEIKKYTAVTKDKTWEIPNIRQIDWISESCPNTIWPEDE